MLTIDLKTFFQVQQEMHEHLQQGIHVQDEPAFHEGSKLMLVERRQDLQVCPMDGQPLFVRSIQFFHLHLIRDVDR